MCWPLVGAVVSRISANLLLRWTGTQDMSTKLDKPIRREIEIDGVQFTLVVGPDGLRLTRKRFRSGLAVSWKALLRQLDRSETNQSGLSPTA